MKNGMFYSLVVKDSSWINILREAAEKSKTKDPQKVKLAQKHGITLMAPVARRFMRQRKMSS